MDIQISALVDSTAQLAPKDFEQFIHVVYHKRATQRTPSLSGEEATLLEKIYHKIPSGIQKRFEQ